MRTRLRALERTLAWDSAEKVLRRVCDHYLYKWDHAVEKGEPPPDAVVLWEMINGCGLSPPGLSETVQYVTRCLRITDSRPEQKHLMGNLLLRRHHN